MLVDVKPKARRFADYKKVVDPKLYGEVQDLAKSLRGKRILHINATALGGGVAEILQSEIPLLNNLGLKADWKVLDAPKEFFNITKTMHNGLQGRADSLSSLEWDIYLEYNRQLAKTLENIAYDFVFIHDPQPAAARSFISNTAAKWIWRCHIDSTDAMPDFTKHFSQFLHPYDGLVFTMNQYVVSGLEQKNIAIIPVAIDPLSAKNIPISANESSQLVASFGVDPNKPLIVQVSRFDPWKDPLGVISAWKLAKKNIPDLQLALIGQASVDDPESTKILEEVRVTAASLNDIYIIANQADDRAVKAFLCQANVVLQKSLREGFGLTVSEALWAETPVIGGNVGGIPEQIQNGRSGYLVESVDETAKCIVELVKNPGKAQKMGKYGHNFIKRHFLIPQLIRDELKLLSSL